LKATIPVLLTLMIDGWAEQMFNLMDAVGWSAVPYFVIMVTFGGFLVLQLFLAVISDTFVSIEQQRRARGPRKDGVASFFDVTDPDGDGLDNYREYLLGSSPLTGAGAWQAQVQNGTSPKLRFLRKSHRLYSIQTSETLGSWSAWTPAGLPSGYSAQDEWIELPIPTTPGGKQFFRFQVSEP
jgi:hypothetical protein